MQKTFGVKDAITYRKIVFEELSAELFAHFNRHQVVTKCWRKRMRPLLTTGAGKIIRL